MTSQELLDQLNNEYLSLHRAYEYSFWDSYMGDKTKDDEYLIGKEALENFKSDGKRLDMVNSFYSSEKDEYLKKRLWYWKTFFELYTIPDELKPLRNEIMALEKKIESNRTTRETWYSDPYSWEYQKMSIGIMRSKMMTEQDEQIRKALFEWSSQTLTDDIDDLIILVSKKNSYARSLWFKHFYDFKSQLEERMDCEEIRSIFDKLRDGAQWAFDYVRNLESTAMPWLRKPWNTSYMLSGDFIKQDDPYFQIEDSLERWGRSMMNCGVHYRWALLQLDLLERDGKYQNGFCHMPVPTFTGGDSKVRSEVNFTCDNKPGVIWEWSDLHTTLFHEGGHAAHFANMDMEDVILNTEYPPASTAWAETQSMFMDTMLSSIERKTRYVDYPFSLFEEKMKKLWPLSAKRMMGIWAIVEFERMLYTTESLSKDMVIDFAKKISDRYFDYSEPFLFALMPGHLYSWESSCSYHGYGLAELGLAQARKYFYEKYGYIVDNPKVWEEMTIQWKLGSSVWFDDCMKWLTGKGISADAYLENINKTIEEVIETAKERIATLEKIPQSTHPIDIGAVIKIVDGKDTICDNSVSFEDMCDTFKTRIQSRK